MNKICEETMYTQQELNEAVEEAVNESKKSTAYSDFTQLNDKQIPNINKLIKLSPIAARIFMFILEHMDNCNAVICSSMVLAEALDCSVSAISKSLKVLKDNGFVKIAKSGSTNVFYLNAEIAWHSYGKNRKYAQFNNASVIFSKSEQNTHYTHDIKAPTVLSPKDRETHFETKDNTIPYSH